VIMSDRITDTMFGAAIAMAVLWTGEWIRARGAAGPADPNQA
jgi:hypothetical protein